MISSLRSKNSGLISLVRTPAEHIYSALHYISTALVTLWDSCHNETNWKQNIQVPRCYVG